MAQQNPAPSNLATLSEVPGTELRQLQATFESFHEFVDRYSPWLSDSSIFVETLEAVPVGAPVRLQIRLRDRPILIRALGQVDWVRTAQEEDGGPPGVALSINHLDSASTRLIDSIFRLYTGQQAAPMGEEIAKTWEVDVESLIDDAFPGDAMTPTGTEDEVAAAPDAGAEGEVAGDGAAKPWSAPVLKPLDIEDLPSAALVDIEPPAPIEELPIEELEAPIVVVPKMPTLEPTLEAEPATPTPEPAAREETGELLPPIELEVDVEPTPPIEDPLTTQPMLAVPIDETPPAATVAPEARPETQPVEPEPRPEEPLVAPEALLQQESVAEEPPTPSFGFGLVEPPLEAPAADFDSAAEILPSLPAEAMDSPEAARGSVPAAPVPVATKSAATPPASPGPAASVAMSRSDKSFLNRSVLLFLLVLAVAGSLFVFFRGPQAPKTPPGGEMIAEAPAAPAIGEAVAAEPVAARPAAAEPTGDAVETPAEPAPAAADPVTAVAEIEDVVKAWAAAWSAQRPEDYIASYAPTYSPSGLSRQQWESQRRVRIRAPASITVRPKNLEVELVDASSAVAKFYQDYETDTKRLFTWKTMELSRLPEGWRIVAERSGR